MNDERITLASDDPDFIKCMRLVEGFLARYRNALRELAN